MEDINPAAAVRKISRPILRALQQRPVQGALIFLLLAAVSVRALKLDTVEVDLGTFPPMNGDFAPPGLHPLRTLDTEIARHPLKIRFMVTYAFEAMPHSAHITWTYNRWTRRLAMTIISGGDPMRSTTPYSHVTDTVIHCAASGEPGVSLESCGAIRGLDISAWPSR